MGVSLLQRAVRAAGVERFWASLTDGERLALQWLWEAHARPEQLPPRGAWRWWLLRSGRGFGKTRSGAEWFRAKVKRMPGSRSFIVSRTDDDVEKVMVNGASGLLAVCPPWERPKWVVSKEGGKLIWPNGAETFAYSAREPESFRGPEHHFGWAEELAAWKYPNEAFDNLSMGLRLDFVREDGLVEPPQAAITTTPKPIAVIRRLMKDPLVRQTTGSTYDNAANLAADFLREMRQKYEGTRLARQELHGEVLDDVPGALWNRAMFDRPGFRLHTLPEHDLRVVAIDPAATSGPDSDETGILVNGRRPRDDGEAERFDVLADRSRRATPNDWALAAVDAFIEFECDRIIGETNNGGEMVEAMVVNAWRERGLPGKPPYEAVHASRGKRTRAEPISMLYEQGRVCHVGELDDLEDQQATWVPGDDSPDRMDANVWGITYLSTAKRVVLA